MMWAPSADQSHVPAGVAHLQAPRQHLIERRAADDAELTFHRDRPREPPVRNSDAHATLNNQRSASHKEERTRTVAGRM